MVQNSFLYFLKNSRKKKNLFSYKVKLKSQVLQVVKIIFPKKLLKQGGRRKLHYIFPDKAEKVEEYDLVSHELLVRKWKKPSNIHEQKWVFEVGEQIITASDPSEQILLSSSKNPIFLRKDTQTEFQFRIRNLPYPKEVYQLTIEKNQIVIRTTNKKYFKKIDIPDLQKYAIQLEEKLLTWSYNNNTLIVSYKKPQKLLEEQKQIKELFSKMNEKKPKEGDIECTQK